MPKLIYRRVSGYNKDNFVGVCNTRDYQSVLDDLERAFAAKNMDSSQMASFKEQAYHIQKAIDELESQKLQLDMTEVEYKDRKFFSKMKNMANQEIERKLTEKRQNLKKIQDEIAHLKNPGSNYYVVDVKLLKPNGKMFNEIS